MQLQQLVHQQSEILHQKETLKAAGIDEVSVKFKGSKYPADGYETDEMESCLRRFELYAELQNGRNHLRL